MKEGSAIGSPRSRTLALSVGALGVVYGDIGTSPLYALRECFFGPHAVAPTRDNILGVLSLIFWSLVLIVSIKYLLFVMRADNRGEGGILALMALARPDRPRDDMTGFAIVVLGLVGAALLYGDSMITPATSVLSAIEGLQVATPVFGRYVVPITVVILIGLFMVQSRGTARVGAVFGPVTLVWFFTIAALGVVWIVREPGVLAAVGPWHGVEFFTLNRWRGFVVLGSIFLAVTGAEALYADMGHFGRRPIQVAWFALVLPALLLNYFGQGALLLRDPGAAESPFFRLTPGWALYPMVALAASAAIIASQAVISGAFSLTRQAVQLGYSPRVAIEHTSKEEIGQIYVPAVNWALMLCTIGLVLSFRSSSALAGAYGIAVSGTMVVTTALFYVVARHRWGWSRVAAGSMVAFFLVIELLFFGANALKVIQGGWFPLAVAAIAFTLMTTWKRGRRILAQRLRESSLPLDLFLQNIADHPPVRVPGTAVFMTPNADGTPPALLHNLKHNKVLHQHVVLLTIETLDIPHVPLDERIEIQDLSNGFFRITARFGFMENPNVPAVLAHARLHGVEAKPMETTYFLGRETLIASPEPGMALWREHLFAFMARNASPATAFFRIPPNRVVELGSQIRL